MNIFLILFIFQALFPFLIPASGVNRRLSSWHRCSQYTLQHVKDAWPALPLSVQNSILQDQQSGEIIDKIQNLSLMMSHLQPLYDRSQNYQPALIASGSFLTNLLGGTGSWLQYTIQSTTTHDSYLLYGLIQYLKVRNNLSKFI